MARHRDSSSLDPGRFAAPVDMLTCLDVPAEAIRAADVRRRFHAWLVSNFQLDEGQLSALTLAVNEALANAAEHAYVESGSPPGTFDVRSHYQPTTGQLTVTVSDRGHWRPSTPDPFGLRGRGIPLMDGLAHSLSIEHDESGTSVQLRWTGIAVREVEIGSS